MRHDQKPTLEHVARAETWFLQYSTRFLTGSDLHKTNIQLKAEHSLRVLENIVEIGRSLDQPPAVLRLLELAALFHDIGRFEQYARYGTFVDAKSENHAALSVKVLKHHHCFDAFDEQTRQILFLAISCHNQLALPTRASALELLVLKALRDADKLDIYHVVTDYYLNRQDTRNPGIELDLPDTPAISPAVVEDILGNRLVRLEHMQTLNDFKVLQLSWLYDINFPKTLELIQSHRYIRIILDQLPECEEKSKIALHVACPVKQ